MKEVQRRQAAWPRAHSQQAALLRDGPGYFRSSAQAVSENHPPLWGTTWTGVQGHLPRCQSPVSAHPHPTQPSAEAQLRRAPSAEAPICGGPICRGPRLWRPPSAEAPSMEAPSMEGPSAEAPICHTTEALHWALHSATSSRCTCFPRNWPHALLSHHPPPQPGEGRTGHAVFHPHTRRPRSLPRPQ